MLLGGRLVSVLSFLILFELTSWFSSCPFLRLCALLPPPCLDSSLAPAPLSFLVGLGLLFYQLLPDQFPTVVFRILPTAHFLELL